MAHGEATHRCHEWLFRGELVMANQQPVSVQTQVRAQFDRHVGHSMQGSAMTNLGLLELIAHMAGPTAGRRV